MAYTSYIRLGEPRRREVALTFDDGPDRDTPRLLRVLRGAHAPATFFELGDAVRAHPAITRLQAREGFAIGDHTRNHPAMGGLRAASQLAQIAATARAIQAAGAPYPGLFRPPFGSFDATTLFELRRPGMLMVLWTVDTRDYSQPRTKRIVYSAVSGARPECDHPHVRRGRPPRPDDRRRAEDHPAPAPARLPVGDRAPARGRRSATAAPAAAASSQRALVRGSKLRLHPDLVGAYS